MSKGAALDSFSESVWSMSNTSTYRRRSSMPLMAMAQRFNVAVPQDELDELRHLLSSGKIGRPTYESLQECRRFGITRRWLVEARQAWLQFDWRVVEDSINAFSNHKMRIVQGGNEFMIHFIGLFSEREDAVPILMLHGWPGSFLEFFPILHLLEQKYTLDELPYHIIVPSLPGYGFSSPPPLNRDFRLEDCAEILDTLMVNLGFDAGYMVQGGDVGSKVARVLGGTNPRAKAIHLNFCIMPDPGDIPTSAYNELEKEGLVRAKEFGRIGSAYALEHATRPSTIGLVLATNPLALLAWVGEKMLEWTDQDPPLSTILEDVTLYWLTSSMGTSLWPYRQLFTPGNIGAHENPIWHINKPLGFSWFPKEIAPVPKAWIETTGNLVFFRQHAEGGHFAALERPEVLLNDLEAFVAQVWPDVKRGTAG